MWPLIKLAQVPDRLVVYDRDGVVSAFLKPTFNVLQPPITDILEACSAPPC